MSILATLIFSVCFPTPGISADTPQPVLRLGKPNLMLLPRTQSLSVSPDGRTLAIGADDGRVALVDSVTLKIFHEFKAHSEDAEVRMLSGGALMTWGKDGRILLWDSKTAKLRRQVWKMTEQSKAFAVSNDGSRVAFYTDQSTITVVDVATGREFAPLGEPSDDLWTIVEHLAFSPDGRRLASSSWKGDVTVWDLAGATAAWRVQLYAETRPLPSRGRSSPPPAVQSLAYSPDGRLLSVGGDHGEVLLFDAFHGTRVLSDKMEGYAGDIAFFPDSRSLLVGDGAGRLRRVRIPEGGDIFSIASYPGHFSDFAVSSDAKTVYALEEGFLGLRSAESGQALVSGMTRTIWTAAYSRSGRLLAAGGTDGVIELYSAASGKLIRRIAAHSEPVSQLAISSDERFLASRGTDEFLRVWSLTSGALVWEAKVGYPYAKGLAFTADGRTLICAQDKSLVAWETRSGKRTREFARHPKTVESMSLSPDGRLVATGCDDGRVRLWDMSSGKDRFSRPEPSERYHSVPEVAFTPDGKQLLARYAWGETLYRISVADGGLLGKQKVEDCVRGTMLSGNGRRVLVSSDDRMLRRWSAEVIDELGGRRAIFHDLPGVGPIMAASPDDKHLVTAADDGRLLVWRVPK